MNIHNEINEMLTAFALGELDTLQSRDVEKHVAECERCRKELAQIQALLNATEQIGKMTVDDQLHQSAVSDVFEAIARTKQEPALKQTNLWRTIMRNPITKIAAAAVIIITAVYFLYPKIGITTPAFADIFKQIYKADSVMYSETFFRGSIERPVFEKMIQRGTIRKNINITNQSGIVRTELQGGNILLFDFADGKTMQLMPSAKKALLTHRTGRKRPRNAFNWLNWVSRLHEKDGKFIGKEKLNGMQTYVYVVEMPYEKTTVWVDPETNLPVQVIITDFPNPDIVVPKISLSDEDFGGQGNSRRTTTITSSRGSPEGIHTEMTRILFDFVWNCQPDDSLFSMEPPEGYNLEEKQFDDSEPDESNLIQALAFWAEMSEGSFPSNINDLCDPNLINPKLIKKYNKESDPKEELEQAMTKANIILKGLYLTQELKANQNWNYNSEGVKFGDSNIPLCWWKQENSDQYRVIYADLSIADVNAQDLTETP